MLQFLLLGAPQVRLNGRPVSGFITSKAEALLFYLAVTARPHTRTTLASLLWPDMPETNARKNLRDVIVSLRKLVGDYLLITNQTLALNPQAAHWVDVGSFNAALAERQSIPLNELREALGLYRGQFLEGFQAPNAFPFDEWLHQKRQECHRLILTGLHELADRFLTLGEYGSALTATRRLLMLEAWDETAHRKQMRLLALSQQRTAALVQFQNCVQALADEWQVQPSPETVTLYEQIRDGHFDQKPQEAAARPDIPLQPMRLTQAAKGETQPFPHNLPRQLTPLVGRAPEIAAVRNKLLDPTCALVTIVGEGGVGKTRLALAVAQSIVDAVSSIDTLLPMPQTFNAQAAIELPFKDGIWFISLASLMANENLPEQLAALTADTLSIPFAGSASLQVQLLERLREKRLLLIFDNFEHVPNGVGFILAILQSVHGAKVLVTTRRRLRLQAEFVYRLKELAVPNLDELEQLDTAQLLRYPALQLFMERAERTTAGLRVTAANQRDIVTICHQVGGLPLGIELAATLMEEHTTSAIVHTLTNNYGALASDYSDLPERQQSMRAVLDSSWQWLTPAEEQALKQCAVFPDSFTAEAAAVVTGEAPAILAGLIDQSLLRRSEDGRYTLHGLIRQYAAEQLEATANGFANGARQRHCEYFVDFLHRRQTAPDLEFQMAVQQEIDNVRAAWHWATDQACLSLLTLSLPGLFKFYELTSLNREAAIMVNRTVSRVRTLLKETMPTTGEQLYLLARLLIEQCHFASKLAQVEEFEHLAQEVIELGQQLADNEIQIKGYEHLSRAAWLRGDTNARLANTQQYIALAQASDRTDLEVQGLTMLGICYIARENYAPAQAWLRRARHTAEQHGHTDLVPRIYLNLGYLAEQRGNFGQVIFYYEEALRRSRQVGKQQDIGIAFYYLGKLYMRVGAYAEAHIYQVQALEIFQQIGYQYYESQSLLALAFLAHATGALDAAHSYVEQALLIAQGAGFHAIEGETQFCLGEVLTSLQHYRQAQDVYQQALILLRAIEGRQVVRRVQASLAHLFLRQHDLVAAQAQVTEILSSSNHPLVQISADRVPVIFTCYQVLEANHNPGADPLLQDAYQQLQAQAATISDKKLRRSFLENVFVNRTLIATYRSKISEP